MLFFFLFFFFLEILDINFISEYWECNIWYIHGYSQIPYQQYRYNFGDLITIQSRPFYALA